MYRRLIENSHEAFSIADLFDIIQDVNPAFCELYGYSPREIIGKPVSVLRPPGVNSNPNILEKTLNGGWVGRVQNVTKEGKEFTAYLTTSSIRDDLGKVVATVGIARDITEQLRLEASEQEAQKKLFYFENLYNLVADAIPNTLGFIESGLSGLKFFLASGRPVDSSIFNGVIEKAHSLTRAITLYRAIQSPSELELTLGPVEKLSIMDSCDDLLHDRTLVSYGDKSRVIPQTIALDTYMSDLDSRDVWIHSSRRAFKLAVSEVLLNAIDSYGVQNPEGMVSLRPYVTNDFVVLEISDSGVGIPSALFSPLLPFKKENKRSSDLGFGLYLTDIVMKHNGGKLEIIRNADRNPQDSGTTVNLYFRRADSSRS